MNISYYLQYDHIRLIIFKIINKKTNKKINNIKNIIYYSKIVNIRQIKD